jgi:creatinine amidohydrolase
MPRPWTRITDDTGVGNPAKSTSAKGSAYFRAVTEKLGAVLSEFAAADPAELFE